MTAAHKQPAEEIEAFIRKDRFGTGPARALRRTGFIPAIIYGGKEEALPVSLNLKAMTSLLHAGGFMNTVLPLRIDGQLVNVLPKEYQLDAVRDTLIHIDFLRVSKDAFVTVNIPVHFENEARSPGLKRGGILNVVRYSVEVNAPATEIPEFLPVDLTGLPLGHSIHISSIMLPERVTPVIKDRDFTIATLVAPAGLRGEKAAEQPEEGEEEESGVENGE